MCRPSANTENSRRMREKPLTVPSHFHIQFNQNCLKWGMKGEQGWCSGENTRLPPIWPFQGPVVRTPISANPQLNFNPGFFFFLPKVLSRKMFSIPFRVTYHQILGKEIKLNLLFKLWYSNSNFALNLDYFNPASNNPVLALTPYFALRGFSPCTPVFPVSSKTNIPPSGSPGGGTPYMKGVGLLVGNFELKP